MIYIAKAIKMKDYCYHSHDLMEIDSIMLNDNKLYKKANLYDYLIEHPGSIKVGFYSGPDMIPAKSAKGEKYVKSKPNLTLVDNLFSLPKIM